jgi:hypothetical protein
MTMRRYRLPTPVLLGLCLAVFANIAPEAVAAATETQVPRMAPGMARVWFLQPAGSINGNVWAQRR